MTPPEKPHGKGSSDSTNGKPDRRDEREDQADELPPPEVYPPLVEEDD